MYYTAVLVQGKYERSVEIEQNRP
eukprot:COSAG06_NODE_10258_length_1716_cov_2.036487_2_plen_23_part_01